MTNRFLVLIGFFFLVCIFNAGLLYGQTHDTLNIAKEFQTKGEIEKSVDLLKGYYKKHKNELYAGWFLADALYKNNDYTNASFIYFKLLRFFPENKDLRLDFAMKSMEEGKFDEALSQLDKLKGDLPKDYKFAVDKAFAKIYFWQGEYDKSLSYINLALDIYDKDKEALKIRTEISRIQSNWMQIDASYMEDNQPLTRMTPDIKMGFYHNARLSTRLGINSSFYSKNYEMSYGGEVNAKVLYRLLKFKASMELGLGFIKLPSNTNSFGASLIIKKTLLKYTDFQLRYEHKPYLSTIASLDEKIMQNVFETSIVRDNPKSWMGKISYTKHSFPSLNNSYFAIGSWIVTSNLGSSKIDFRVGYGFNYSDSKRNNFNSTMTIEELLSQKDTAIIIKGVYDPFFSPKNQKVQSLIGMVSYKPVRNINIGLKINYGVSATFKTPYLSLDREENGDLVINKSYFDDSYYPVEINGYISYELANQVSVKAYYRYLKTIYFSSYITGLITKFIF